MIRVLQNSLILLLLNLLNALQIILQSFQKITALRLLIFRTNTRLSWIPFLVRTTALLQKLKTVSKKITQKSILNTKHSLRQFRLRLMMTMLSSLKNTIRPLKLQQLPTIKRLMNSTLSLLKNIRLYLKATKKLWKNLKNNILLKYLASRTVILRKLKLSVMNTKQILLILKKITTLTLVFLETVTRKALTALKMKLKINTQTSQILTQINLNPSSRLLEAA